MSAVRQFMTITIILRMRECMLMDKKEKTPIKKAALLVIGYIIVILVILYGDRWMQDVG